MRLVALGEHTGKPAIRKLVAVSHGTTESASRVLEHYRSGAWTLLGYELDGAVVACIGFEGDGDRIVIRSLSVDAGHRRRGLARNLIVEIAARFPQAALVAETDADAVEFYKGCGFTVQSLGEKYPGVERFRCARAAAGAGTE